LGLEAPEWVENDRERWADAQRRLHEYFEEHGNLLVPAQHSTLGTLVNHIRSRGCFVKGRRERLRFLHSLGFRMHATDDAEDAKRWEKLWRNLDLETWERASP